jgi:hypothetical protein
MRYPKKIEQFISGLSIALDRENKKQIRELRDIHAGGQCVVLATGPSVKQIDLGLLADHPFVFGVNGAYKIFDRFKYYFVSCPNFYIPNEAALAQVETDRLFLSSHIVKKGPPGSVKIRVREDQVSIASSGKFERDLTKTLYWGPTVMLDLVFPVALWMGFTEIVLIGADFTLRDYRHFYAENEHLTLYKAKSEPEMLLAHRGFRVLKPVLDEMGVHVYNCSPSSDLTVFEKRTLEDALAVIA